MNKIKAYGSTILAKLDDDSTTEGGIIIRSGSKDSPRWATVVSVGHEVSGHLQGARILIRKYDTQSFSYDGEDLIHLRPEHIIAQES